MLVADRLYSPLAKWFKAKHPHCLACSIRRNPVIAITSDIHHSHGRTGALRFFFPWFVPVCRECHEHIDANREWARGVGLLAPLGMYNTQSALNVWRVDWIGGFTYVAALEESAAHRTAQASAEKKPFTLKLIE